MASTQVDKLWYVGLLLELTGTTFNIAGKQCLRQATLSGNKWWVLLGVLSFLVVYPCFNVLALSLAPSTVVFATDGMIVVWNILSAPYTLGEPVTVARLTAAALIICGTVGAGAFGIHTEAKMTSEIYLAMFSTGSAIAYFSILLIVALVLYLVKRRFKPETVAGGMWTGHHRPHACKPAHEHACGSVGGEGR